MYNYYRSWDNYYCIFCDFFCVMPTYGTLSSISNGTGYLKLKYSTSVQQFFLNPGVIWNLASGSFSYLRNSVCKYTTEFRGNFTAKIPRNSTELRMFFKKFRIPPEIKKHFRGHPSSGPKTDKHLPQSPITGNFFKMTTFCIAFYVFLRCQQPLVAVETLNRLEVQSFLRNHIQYCVFRISIVRDYWDFINTAV
jgi:hypothetical protein